MKMFSSILCCMLLSIVVDARFHREAISSPQSMVVAWDNAIPEENSKLEEELPILMNALQSSSSQPKKGGRPNLLQLATSLNLTTFVSLVHQTHVDKTIDHEGPYTLFAPSNRAFQSMPKWSVRYPIGDIVKFHVAHGQYKQSELQNDQLIRSLLSKRDVRVNVYEKKDGSKIYTANGQQLNQTDYEAHNGVLHVVEGVMSAVYERRGTVFAELESGKLPVGTFNALTRCLKGTGLSAILTSVGPFTLFAPTDKAFSGLPSSLVDRLLANRTAMEGLLKHHVLNGTLYSLGMEDGESFKSLKGKGDALTVKFGESGSVQVEDGEVVLKDFSVSNGVIHAIDKVLIPKDMDGQLLAWLIQDDTGEGQLL